ATDVPLQFQRGPMPYAAVPFPTSLPSCTPSSALLHIHELTCSRSGNFSTRPQQVERLILCSADARGEHERQSIVHSHRTHERKMRPQGCSRARGDAWRGLGSDSALPQERSPRESAIREDTRMHISHPNFITLFFQGDFT